MASFRRELAGLSDLAAESVHADAWREATINLCVVMCRLFSDQLDRKTLWERIGSSLKSAAAKRPQGGESLISAALEHVLADPGRSANCEELGSLLAESAKGSDEWNRGWAAWITRHLHVAVVFGRQRWQEVK